jgi:hypothetical protein
MKRKFNITVIIFFSAFMLNVSAMAFQQRYDRREDDEDYDPFVIEMMDQHVFKYLKNTWFFDYPLSALLKETEKIFFLDDRGFGNRYVIQLKPFLSCHLKFVLIETIGFFTQRMPEHTHTDLIPLGWAGG